MYQLHCVILACCQHQGSLLFWEQSDSLNGAAVQPCGAPHFTTCSNHTSVLSPCFKQAPADFENEVVHFPCRVKKEMCEG
jgi:hypothetical protein